MANIPKKAIDRLVKNVVLFQKILQDAKDRDVNEFDTVTIIMDMLAGVFGYDKYIDITSEQAIRGTYCDLAIKLNGTIKYLIEVKAIGLTLKENHLRQAVNYGSNQGIPWVILTNGISWEIYKIHFEQPIRYSQVCSFNFLELSPKKNDHLDFLYLLCKEGLAKAVIEEYHEHVQIVNRFVVGAIIRSEPVLSIIRRELKKLAPECKTTVEEINGILPDVLKRDVIEGDTAKEAEKRVKKLALKPVKKTTALEIEPPADITQKPIDQPISGSNGEV